MPNLSIYRLSTPKLANAEAAVVKHGYEVKTALEAALETIDSTTNNV
jgi:hypothetical protein